MQIRYFLSAVFVVILWGISLLFTRILLDHGFTPNSITFFRFLLAGFLMSFTVKKKYKIEPSDRKYFVVMALGGTSLFYYFENTALRFTTVSNTALITSTIPLFTLIFAFFFLKKKLNWQNFLGIPLGIIGTIILVYKDLTISGTHLKGDIFAFGSVLMWVFYSFAFRKVMHKYDTYFIVYRTFGLGVLFLIPFMLFELDTWKNIQIDFAVILNFLFLSVGCSFLGYFFWNLALKKIGVKIISNLILFIPIVSISASVIFLREEFSLNLVISAILISCGAFFTSVSKENNRF